MIIENKKVVSVNYRLTVSENDFLTEELVEETFPEQPFVFLLGSGGLLEEFEANLRGKSKNDRFDFKITAENGYGMSSNENIVKIPMNAFIGEGEELDSEMVTPGNFVPMVDNEGNQLQGLVLEVTTDHVTMDFNHPLAGKDLHFVGSVVDIREAAPEELAHGHVHGPDGHHHN
jgi:FKBP-type peptidyl-prolyl cis-trans isomerase SlyD